MTTAAKLSPDAYDLLAYRLRQAMQYAEAARETVATALVVLESVPQEKGAGDDA
jgi:hypothetical protein